MRTLSIDTKARANLKRVQLYFKNIFVTDCVFLTSSFTNIIMETTNACSITCAVWF